jgi:hypothetical protein
VRALVHRCKDSAGATLDAARARFWRRPNKPAATKGKEACNPSGAPKKTPRRTLRMKRKKWRRVDVGLTSGWCGAGAPLILIRPSTGVEGGRRVSSG